MSASAPLPSLSLTLCLPLFLTLPASAQCPAERVVFTEHQSNPAAARVGTAVALSGDRLAAASYNEDVTVFGQGDPTRGAVYLHARVGDAWVLEDRLFLPGAIEEAYGFDVALDGDVAAVGLPSFCAIDFIIGACPPGAVIVYGRDAGSWQQLDFVQPAESAMDDLFGLSLAVDGDTLVAGAPGTGVGTDTGAVYVFERSGDDWLQVDALVGGPLGTSARFGHKVAMDGDVLAVVAPGEPIGPGQSGVLFVFERAAGVWSQAARLELEVWDNGFEKFRISLDVSGERVVVGSPRTSVSTGALQGVQNGAAVVVEKVAGVWTETARLRASDADTDDLFGASVATDGEHVLVGSVFANGVGPSDGGAYLFEKTPLGWAQTAKWTGAEGTGFDTERAGFAVDLDAGRLAYSAPFCDVGEVLLAGAVYTGEVGDVPCAGQDLVGAPGLVALADGGAHVLRLQVDDAHAGAAYLVLGSATGTAPGIPLTPTAVLPLVPDAYFVFTAATANVAPFVATLGTLDASATAVARIDVPAGANPALAGLSLFHAAVVFDPVGSAVVDTTAPAALTLLP